MIERIVELRRRRVTGEEIAQETGVSPANVSQVLGAPRLRRMRDLDPPEPVRRYERETPGELIHLDIKKLGRFDKAGHRVTADRTVESRKAERFIQTSLREWAFARETGIGPTAA